MIYDYVLLDEFLDPEFRFSSDSAMRDEQRRLFKKYAEAWGKYAEAVTARYLLRQGLPIRAMNWKASPKSKGEIDIITQRGNRIVFVEVKARCGKHDDPISAIDEKKIKLLCRGADKYLKMQNEDYDYQFDVALLRGSYLDYDFEYIEDAFMAPLSTR